LYFLLFFIIYFSPYSLHITKEKKRNEKIFEKKKKKIQIGHLPVCA